MIFRQRKKGSLEERKLALTSQIEQLKKELDSKERPDYKQSLQDVVNALVSTHLIEGTHIPHQQKMNGTGFSPKSVEVE